MEEHVKGELKKEEHGKEEPKNEEHKKIEALEETEKQASRGNTKVSNTKVSNYTFLFGCNPAEGVRADTNFVDLFIKHISGLFDPETGSV